MTAYSSNSRLWTDVVPAGLSATNCAPPMDRPGLGITEREAIFLRHHGLPVERAALKPTNFSEWMRIVICLARRNDPYLFDAGGRIRDHERFTQWVVEAYPPKETS
ncbi:hypothetical protein [Falsirhodobacter sp. 1013]|uniref:hypothetical protein n=1 Tax=Falsirhodobacter sp. 1013 TaxID=3417566 RepID=UPI003EB6FA49